MDNKQDRSAVAALREPSPEAIRAAWDANARCGIYAASKEGIAAALRAAYAIDLGAALEAPPVSATAELSLATDGPRVGDLSYEQRLEIAKRTCPEIATHVDRIEGFLVHLLDSNRLWSDEGTYTFPNGDYVNYSDLHPKTT